MRPRVVDVRRLVLLAAAVVAVAETYRRGYTAPLLFGLRLHVRSRPDWLYEPDYMA